MCLNPLRRKSETIYTQSSFKTSLTSADKMLLHDALNGKTYKLNFGLLLDTLQLSPNVHDPCAPPRFSRPIERCVPAEIRWYDRVQNDVRGPNWNYCVILRSLYSFGKGVKTKVLNECTELLATTCLQYIALLFCIYITTTLSR